VRLTVAEFDTSAVQDAMDSAGIELGDSRTLTAPSPSATCPAIPTNPRQTYRADH